MARTYIDDYFPEAGCFAGRKDPNMDHVLDRSMSRDPAPEQPAQVETQRGTYWSVFQDRAREKMRQNGCQFFTFTLHSKLMYHKQYICRMDPLKQAKCFKSLVRDVMNNVNKDVEISYYIFFEYSKKNSILHCHGVAYAVSDEVVYAYPWYSNQLKASAKKMGFRMRGTDVQSVLHINEVLKYISKDAGKHPIQGLHS